MSWVPNNEFEEEIVSLQPNHNFIFGDLTHNVPEVNYPRPQTHLDYIAQQRKKCTKSNDDAESGGKGGNKKLNIIAKVQKIAGNKRLGEQPTINDWDDRDDAERETIAMMRHFGLGPSIEEPLDNTRTIATHPINKDMYIMQNGRKSMPIFFDEKFFELKPRSPSSDSPSSDTLQRANQSTSTFINSSVTTNADEDSGDDVNQTYSIVSPRTQLYANSSSVSSSSSSSCKVNYEKLQNTTATTTTSGTFQSGNYNLDLSSDKNVGETEENLTDPSSRQRKFEKTNSKLANDKKNSIKNEKHSVDNRHKNLKKEQISERFYTTKELYSKKRGK